MIKGAIFDLDGTVLNSMPVWDNAASMYLKSIGIEAEPGLDKIMFSMSMTEGAGYLRDRYGLDLDEDAIIAGINHAIEDFYYYQVPLKEGVKGFLEEMKQAGIKMVVATASDRHVVERALERLNVLSYFERIFTCTEIRAGKGKPDIYLAAAGYMGTFPEETLVFEDALYAIRTAKTAGFITVGVYDDSSKDDLEEIKKICDYFVYKPEDFNNIIEMIYDMKKE